MRQEDEITLKRLAALQSELLSEEKLASNKVEEAKKDLDDIRNRRLQVTGTLQQLMASSKIDHEVEPMPEWKKRADKLVSQIETIEAFPMERLKGLTQGKALIVIAKHFGGLVRTQDVRLILVKSGLMKDTPNVDSMVYQLLTGSERFERVSHGLYRLKNYDPPAQPQVTRLQPSPHILN